MNLSFVIFIAVVSQSTGQVYDREIEVCCDGIVHSISNYTERNILKCCGTSLYNHSTSRCCDGEVLELPSNMTDPEKFKCCGGTWYEYKDFKLQCCKDKLYSIREKICNPIEGTLFDIADNKDLGFCRGIAYNVSYQQCGHHNFYTIDNGIFICNQNYTKKWAIGCCGDTTFDPNHEQCCIDTVHPRYTDKNSRIHNLCCGRNVYPLKLNYDMKPQREKFTCCGDIVIEKSSITEKCCGSIRYNTSDSLCCQGVLLENPPFGHKCCGTTSYNTESSLCCNGNIYPLDFSSKACYYNLQNAQDRKNYISERDEEYMWRAGGG